MAAAAATSRRLFDWHLREAGTSMFLASRAIGWMQIEPESVSKECKWSPPPTQCRCVRGGNLKGSSVGEPGGCGFVGVSAAM